MRRDIFSEEHEAFRDLVREFLAREVTPFHAQWEKDKVVSREVWLKAGKAGLLGIDVDEKHGGGGNPDYRYYAIMDEEVGRAGATGLGFFVHNDMIGQYLLRLCTPEQKERWFPGYCGGDLITAIAMTEPGAGSDLQGIRTTAVRDGDYYLLNGQKTFITNGQLADLVIVVARTNPEQGHKGISLLMVERGMPGFERGRNLDKIGMHAQDTSELFFTDVRVPAANLLGEEGQGWSIITRALADERTMSFGGRESRLLLARLVRRWAQSAEDVGRHDTDPDDLAMLGELVAELEIERLLNLRPAAMAERGEDVAGEGSRSTVVAGSISKVFSSELAQRTAHWLADVAPRAGAAGDELADDIAVAERASTAFTIIGGTSEVQRNVIADRGLGLARR
jgi:acyl-CoA dehydrogenase